MERKAVMTGHVLNICARLVHAIAPGISCDTSEKLRAIHFLAGDKAETSLIESASLEDITQFIVKNSDMISLAHIALIHSDSASLAVIHAPALTFKKNMGIHFCTSRICVFDAVCFHEPHKVKSESIHLIFSNPIFS